MIREMKDYIGTTNIIVIALCVILGCATYFLNAYYAREVKQYQQERLQHELKMFEAYMDLERLKKMK